MALADGRLRCFGSGRRCWSLLGSPASIRTIGGLRPATATQSPQPGQTGHAANRAGASHPTDEPGVLGPYAARLLAIDADARHRHELVGEPLCLCMIPVRLLVSPTSTV